MEFVVSGRRVHLTAEDVVRKLRGVEPGTITRHVVEVEGRLYPVKEAFARVTGLDPLDFSTNQARRAFQRLGFLVKRVGQ